MDYRTISNLYGIRHSRVCIIISNVSIKLTVDILLPKKNFAPTQERTSTGICDFEKISGFLKEFGVINGCRVRTKAPLIGADDYITWKDYHAIVLQNLVVNSYLYFMTYLLCGLTDNMTRHVHDISL